MKIKTNQELNQQIAQLITKLDEKRQRILNQLNVLDDLFDVTNNLIIEEDDRK
jgi:flagellar capping protein FliD